MASFRNVFVIILIPMARNDEFTLPETERIAPKMASENFKDQCSDITKEFNIQIPCRLAERVEGFASANNTTITGVVIEALDTFLREQKNRVG
jgi:hypothetical protein